MKHFMSKKAEKGIIYRVLFYLIGQMCAAMGVVLSVKSDLGVSAGSSLPNVVNKIIAVNGETRFLFWDLSKLGDCMTIFFVILVVLQFILLRRDFEKRNLLQLFSSVIFGVFVNIADHAVSWIEIQSYFGRMTILLAGLLVQAAGIAVYIDTKLMLMPPEGVVLALNKKLRIPVGRAKLAEDSVIVLTALILSLLVLHRVEGIREGTVILTVMVGPVMGRIHDKVERPLKKLFYFEDDPVLQS